VPHRAWRLAVRQLRLILSRFAGRSNLRLRGPKLPLACSHEVDQPSNASPSFVAVSCFGTSRITGRISA
jgi:hypothetical protein